MTGRELELAAEARGKVGRVLALLECPNAAALDRSTAELAEAVARMRQIQQIQKEAAAGGAPLQSAIAALRTDLSRVRLLLRRAREFHVCRGGQPVYTLKGELASQPPGGRWTLQA